MNQNRQQKIEDPVVLSDEENIEEIDRDADDSRAIQPRKSQALAARERDRRILSDDFYQIMDKRRENSGLVNTASDLARDLMPPTNLEETLRLRLDLNLDLEVRLRAHLHGDLTLALLYLPI